MKIKILQRAEKKFLLKRTYKKIYIDEYIICQDYDFKSNTYKIGFIVYDITLAYKIFNDFVVNDNLPDLSGVAADG